MLYRLSWLPGSSLANAGIHYLILLVCLPLFLFLFNFKSLLNYKVIFIKNDHIIFLGLFLLFFISTAINGLIEIRNDWFLRRLLGFFSYFLLYFVLLPEYLFKHKNSFFTFIRNFSNVGFFTSLLGIVLLGAGITPVEFYKGNLVSYCVHPNYISYLITISTLFTLYLLLGKFEFKLNKKFLLASLRVQFIAQILTLCRGGLIATSLGIIIFLFFRYRFKFIYFLPVLISIIPLAFLSTFETKGTGSNISRLLLLIPAFNMMVASKTSLLFGYGASNTFEVYEYFRDFYFIAEKVNNPHNTLVQLILMFGLIFTILFLIFASKLLFFSFAALIKSKDPQQKFFYGFMIVMMISISIQGLFDSTLVMTEFFSIQFMLMIMGIIYKLKKSAKDNSEDSIGVGILI